MGTLSKDLGEHKFPARDTSQHLQWIITQTLWRFLFLPLPTALHEVIQREQCSLSPASGRQNVSLQPYSHLPFYLRLIALPFSCLSCADVWSLTEVLNTKFFSSSKSFLIKSPGKKRQEWVRRNGNASIIFKPTHILQAWQKNSLNVWITTPHTLLH